MGLLVAEVDCGVECVDVLEEGCEGGEPWVQSMKMSSMKRSQMNAKRLLLGN